MFSKIIAVLFAANVISAANGFIDSKLRVLEPILKCYEGDAPEFAGEKAMAASLNFDLDAALELSCRVIGVSSRGKLMLGKLNQDIFKRD